ncbi:MAG: LLM class flavin-dependent oxidoreductase [Chloroflexota bacterium]
MTTVRRLHLSVLDQSPVRRGGTAADALRETVALAQRAEALGYERFWVAEHHNSAGFAGTTPEVLIGQIAAATSTIRVGSGGVMLSHYSALKVAETFRVLNAFYPGRVDLGIGRAPGSDQRTMLALAHPREPTDVRQFPNQVLDLLRYLSDAVEEPHPFARVHTQPGPPPDRLPELWLLGSSDYSAELAAALGLPFAFADFFGNTRDIGPNVAARYRSGFQPSDFLTQPRLTAAVQCICAETEERAHYVGSSRNLSKLNAARGIRSPLAPPDEATAYVPNVYEQEGIADFSRGYIDGNPAQVRDRLLDIAQRYGTDDLTIVTNCYAFEDRVRSYELIAQEFQLAA